MRTFVMCVVLTAVSLGAGLAQDAPLPQPPGPPVPAVAPAPAVPESAPVAASLPAPPAPAAAPEPDWIDLTDLKAELRDLSVDLEDMRFDWQSPMSNFAVLADKFAMADSWDLAQVTPNPMPKPRPAPEPNVKEKEKYKVYSPRYSGRGWFMRGDSDYEMGSRALDRRQWDKAVERFQAVIDKNGKKADGAFYWKAYALNRLGRGTEGLASLNQMQQKFPNSRWNEDARVLAAEIKRTAGHPISPDEQSDEDIKLYALTGLLNSDPERVVPVLEKMLATSTSPGLKERALFVLARVGTPKAMTLLATYARGASNPDLQLKAIEYLGVSRGENNRALLSELYGSLSDTDARSAVLRAFLMARDKTRLLEVARTEKNPELMSQAVRYLGTMSAGPELRSLYGQAPTSDAKEAVIDGLFLSKDLDGLIEIARSEPDKRLRGEAVEKTGLIRSDKTSAALRGLYGNEKDEDVKAAALRGLYLQKDIASLVSIARAESNPRLKKEAVSLLAESKSKEASDYLVELLSK